MFINLYIARPTYHFFLIYTCGLTVVIKRICYAMLCYGTFVSPSALDLMAWLLPASGSGLCAERNEERAGDGPDVRDAVCRHGSATATSQCQVHLYAGMSPLPGGR